MNAGPTNETDRAMLDHEKAKVFFTMAEKHIKEGAKEDPLRYDLCTNLPNMFPGDHWWIREHAQHAEENQTYSVDNQTHKGFADVMIGYTAVEYEKNLTRRPIFAEGYHQVEDYCAGLLNRGIAVDRIIGVLSDTVRWHAYRVSKKNPESPENDVWGGNDITLEEIDKVDLSIPNEARLEHFEDFINKYYGRFGSRQLTPDSLVEDFGVEAGTANSYMNGIRKIVDHAIQSRPGYAGFVEKLWTEFIETVGGSQNNFREDFSHELYIVTLAKLIAANILERGLQSRDGETIKSVLDGDFFIAKGINNLVEYDYFGWVNENDNLSKLADQAMLMQRDLMVYDFTDVKPVDIFGPLLSQLASSDKRLLLGQAPTPHWLADRMAAKMIDSLDAKKPRFVDMCVGSGIFVVAVLNHLRDKWNRERGGLTDERLNDLAESICGFDVDPVAVLLAKVNWILVMNGYMDRLPRDLRIPIYHADSLFTRTPVTIGGDGDTYVAKLYDRTVSIPEFLFDGRFRRAFDRIVYDADVATSLCRSGRTLERHEASEIVRADFARHGAIPEDDDLEHSIDLFLELSDDLRDLRARDRNGIWPFILTNTFKPAFEGRLFNGIISNPPWLALSRLAQNPYKGSLEKLARDYGIMPQGSSFLHVEIATVFLVASADRYLEEGGTMACVMPHSILNGRHEEPFRHAGYLNAKKPVRLELCDIWDLPTDTFKNKAVVLFARKTEQSPQVRQQLDGLILNSSDDPGTPVKYSLVTNGKATAYAHDARNLTQALDYLPFEQGFDGMPRTAVFFRSTRQPNGGWTLSSIPRAGGELSGLVSDAKKCKDFSIGTVPNVDDSLLFDDITSNQLMPFADIKPVKAFLAVKMNAKGELEERSDAELSILSPGSALVARRVKQCSDGGVGFYRKGYLNYLNTRGKLAKTLQDKHPWRVLYGAGGTNIAATLIKVDDISVIGRLTIDQTLYWKGVDTEDEALYYVGLLNSTTINESIKEFQPEGEFGKRHIHTLPLGIIDEYDSNNEQHRDVVTQTRAMRRAVLHLCNTNTEVAELLKLMVPLHFRRRAFQKVISNLPEKQAMDTACRLVI